MVHREEAVGQLCPQGGEKKVLGEEDWEFQVLCGDYYMYNIKYISHVLCYYILLYIAYYYIFHTYYVFYIVIYIDITYIYM